MPSNPFGLKQIRFVNTDRPPSKRRRVNAACRTCRRRKTRCDGVKPECLTCSENGHECMGYADDTGDEKKPHKLGGGSEGYGDGNASRRREQGSGDIQGTFSPIGATDSSKLPLHPGLKRNIHSISKSDNDLTGIPETTRVVDHAHRNENHRVPFFRYFGPTAIVPGFKQMVVSLKEQRSSRVESGPLSSSIHGPSDGNKHPEGSSKFSTKTPIYIQGDSKPVNRLIINLVGTFFSHLGCNFPFLRREPFLSSVEECVAETILVNSVCALAARFSDHPLLTAGREPSFAKSDYGHVFAQRAKAAVVDAFPCPSISAVQACLLLAYESFGANQDSALWMFLGCAIRMAVDLGLQKPDGIKHQAAEGSIRYHSNTNDVSAVLGTSAHRKDNIEQECLDTLWAVFILDRLISSGTGRSATLKDADLELQFPAVSLHLDSGWPNPFPALIRIIHLYGRVSDLLNNIKNIQDVTLHRIEGLADMEMDLTQLYQKLDQRLTFNAENFKYYTKAGDGTNFIMVHFWFHALIILLHQPTLMHSFEGQILQLLPKSRELSMSSAKTIADILAFAELIDPKSFIGNPFSVQPIYIAACAFLLESSSHSTSQPASRNVSPPSYNSQTHYNTAAIEREREEQKRSQLAAAANQNYQRCHNALQQSEAYWGGVRYIRVALEQKAEGIWDPETYTEQEYESTKPINDILRGWGRKHQDSAHSSGSVTNSRRQPRPNISSPGIDPIGWSVTGTTNSPSSNLTFMYQSMNTEARHDDVPTSGASNMIYDPVRQSLPGAISVTPLMDEEENMARGKEEFKSMAPPAFKYRSTTGLPTSSDADILRGSHSPIPQGTSSHQSEYQAQSAMHPVTNFRFPESQEDMLSQSSFYYGLGGYGDLMTMESQEVDMSSLGGEMMPWLDYLPQDTLQYYDNSHDSRM